MRKRYATGGTAGTAVGAAGTVGTAAPVGTAERGTACTGGAAPATQPSKPLQRPHLPVGNAFVVVAHVLVEPLRGLGVSPVKRLLLVPQHAGLQGQALGLHAVPLHLGE